MEESLLSINGILVRPRLGKYLLIWPSLVRAVKYEYVVNDSLNTIHLTVNYR